MTFKNNKIQIIVITGTNVFYRHEFHLMSIFLGGYCKIIKRQSNSSLNIIYQYVAMAHTIAWAT